MEAACAHIHDTLTHSTLRRPKKFSLPRSKVRGAWCRVLARGSQPPRLQPARACTLLQCCWARHAARIAHHAPEPHTWPCFCCTTLTPGNTQVRRQDMSDAGERAITAPGASLLCTTRPPPHSAAHADAQRASAAQGAVCMQAMRMACIVASHDRGGSTAAAGHPPRGPPAHLSGSRQKFAAAVPKRDADGSITHACMHARRPPSLELLAPRTRPPRPAAPPPTSKQLDTNRRRAGARTHNPTRPQLQRGASSFKYKRAAPTMPLWPTTATASRACPGVSPAAPHGPAPGAPALHTTPGTRSRQRRGLLPCRPVQACDPTQRATLLDASRRHTALAAPRPSHRLSAHLALTARTSVSRSHRHERTRHAHTQPPPHCQHNARSQRQHS